MSQTEISQQQQENPGWVLRILNGTRQGGEIALSATRYRLGSATEDDVVLPEEGITPHHMEFFFADGSLSILRNKGQLYANGALVETFPTDIAPLAVIETGAIAFCYGRADSKWPDAPQPKEQQKPDRKPQRKPWIALFAIGSALVGVFMIFGVGGILVLEHAKSKNISPPTPIGQLLQSDQAFKNVLLIRAPGGAAPSLKGTVSNESDFKRLRALLQDRNINFDVRIQSRINSNIQSALEEAQAENLHYKWSENTLVLQGVLQNQQSLDRLQMQLKAAAPDIMFDMSGLVFAENILASARLAKNARREYSQLQLQLSLENQPARLQISGPVFESDHSAIVKALKELLTKGQNLIALDDKATIIPDIAFQIEAVLLGPNPIAQLRDTRNNGIRDVMIGDNIGDVDQFVIKNIDDEGITLERSKNGTRLFVRKISPS